MSGGRNPAFVLPRIVDDTRPFLNIVRPEMSPGGGVQRGASPPAFDASVWRKPDTRA